MNRKKLKAFLDKLYECLEGEIPERHKVISCTVESIKINAKGDEVYIEYSYCPEQSDIIKEGNITFTTEDFKKITEGYIL